jgi:hypothetical protein
MICPHCFLHLELTRDNMQDLMKLHIGFNSSCLQNIEEKSEKEKMHLIEITLRQAQLRMESLHQDFNSVPNAERFVVSCLKANEALRQMQRGNNETVEQYWRDEE